MIVLPAEVTFKKCRLRQGGWSYDFRHRVLGALGHILLPDFTERGEIQVLHTVAGDPEDPQTAERHAVLERLGLEIALRMGGGPGPYSDPGEVEPFTRPKIPFKVGESKIVQCSRCGAFVALLVFAPGATNARRLEDYARLMYPEYSRRGLPAWIIGPPCGPSPKGPCDILQVWPNRMSMQRLTLGQLDLRVDRLVRRHCQPGPKP